jgi:DNA-binding MarR family transcriptional regulator
MDEGKKRKAKPSDADSLDASHLGIVGELFTVRLQRAGYLLTAATSRAWDDHSLRTGTIGVLSLIASHPGISQNEIAKRTTFDKSAISAIVSNLEDLGWATRNSSARDRRSNALHVTELGQSRLQEIIDRIQGIERQMLALVPPGALQSLSELLDLVHASCLQAD